MNIVKYYRPRNDGNVEVVFVKINNRTNRKATPGGYRWVRHRLPSVAQADRSMLRSGWSRERIEPGKIRLSALTRAINALGLAPLPAR